MTVFIWKRTGRMHQFPNPTFWRVETACKNNSCLLFSAFTWRMRWLTLEEQVTKEKEQPVSYRIHFTLCSCGVCAVSLRLKSVLFWNSTEGSIAATTKSTDYVDNNVVGLEVITVVLAWFWKMAYLREGGEKVVVSQVGVTKYGTSESPSVTTLHNIQLN